MDDLNKRTKLLVQLACLPITATSNNNDLKKNDTVRVELQLFLDQVDQRLLLMIVLESIIVFLL
jgi:hypothetical protein